VRDENERERMREKREEREKKLTNEENLGKGKYIVYEVMMCIQN
jgi:hypothetical protein